MNRDLWEKGTAPICTQHPLGRSGKWGLSPSSLGRISQPFAGTFAVVLISSIAFAQAPEQHWQAAPNYPSSSGPNYQPSTAPAAGTTTGNSTATAPAAGPYQYQPPQTANAGQPRLPPLETRPAAAADAQYGQQIPPDNRQGYPQYPAAQGAPGQGQPTQGQPIQGPPIQGPPARPTGSKVPFVLSPPEMAALENLLTDWERRNREIHILHSKFFRWRYDAVFATPASPNSPPPPPDEGELKFSAPDKAWMKIDAKDPKLSEQWLCDGKSVFQWDYSKNIVTEFIMPPEMQGKGIGDGPLPFVFGIEAQKLKQRYFMRIITPPNVQNEVWLEAYPKWQQDAGNYMKVEVILQLVGQTRTLFPYAIQIYGPNGKDRIVYQLQNPSINPRGILGGIFDKDWTKPAIPYDWKKMIRLPDNPSREAGANRPLPQQR
jgi:TIGR03009 family protein